MSRVCGRFASFRAAQDLAEAFDVDEVTPAAAAVVPSYNVAPTQEIRIVLDRRGDGAHRREMHAARWGLVPSWATDRRIGSRLINARRESLDSKPAFRASLARRRCIVPVEGYYEWERRDGHRVPSFIAPPSGEPLALAGLYAFWLDPERAEDDPDRWVLSATIVTTAATGTLAAIHDRVPAVLDRPAVEAWLDPDADRPADVLALLAASPPLLVPTRVSSRVNSPANDGPALITPAVLESPPPPGPAAPVGPPQPLGPHRT